MNDYRWSRNRPGFSFRTRGPHRWRAWWQKMTNHLYVTLGKRS